ncbi:hypothetical protein N7539_006936 [Penicillium diatomitis]|uniref:Uncharacterized protein n=1 Tax=Penicillium diatomitis TaxID=2819901 RepID=A0A9X0BSR6_9EURO|nr:uncharacterized protein N7539_006936 [Penicillium diatomitis]KAJ5481042.1 hypothetical protein N7539_006936 [Penicillium diatomitis]
MANEERTRYYQDWENYFPASEQKTGEQDSTITDVRTQNAAQDLRVAAFAHGRRRKAHGQIRLPIQAIVHGCDVISDAHILLDTRPAEETHFFEMTALAKDKSVRGIEK